MENQSKSEEVVNYQDLPDKEFFEWYDNHNCSNSHCDVCDNARKRMGATIVKNCEFCGLPKGDYDLEVEPGHFVIQRGCQCDVQSNDKSEE